MTNPYTQRHTEATGATHKWGKHALHGPGESILLLWEMMLL